MYNNVIEKRELRFSQIFLNATSKLFLLYYPTRTNFPQQYLKATRFHTFSQLNIDITKSLLTRASEKLTMSMFTFMEPVGSNALKQELCVKNKGFTSGLLTVGKTVNPAVLKIYSVSN